MAKMLYRVMERYLELGLVKNGLHSIEDANELDPWGLPCVSPSSTDSTQSICFDMEDTYGR